MKPKYKMPALEVREMGFSREVGGRHFIGRIKLFGSKKMKPQWSLTEQDLKTTSSMRFIVLARGEAKNRSAAVRHLNRAWECVKWE